MASLERVGLRSWAMRARDDHPDRRFLRALASLLVLLSSTAAVIAASGSSPAQAPPAGDASLGKKLFVKCAPCHKADGSGGIKLTGNPTPNWRDPKRMADPKYGDEYLRECMTHGKLKSGMQPVTRIGVKPEEIPHLIAHIR